MKKIISMIIAFSAVFSLVSCSVESGKTTAEKVSDVIAEQSSLVEASIQAEVERSEEMVDSIDEIGKTKKNKQIVVKRPYAHGEHYQVYVMNRKGICKEVLEYYYYDSAEMFELNNKRQKVETRLEKIDSDKTTRMIVYKSDYNVEERNQYDQLYNLFKTDEFIMQGYEVIE